MISLAPLRPCWLWCGLCMLGLLVQTARSQASDSATQTVLRSQSTFSPALNSAVGNLATTFVLSGSKDEQAAAVQSSVTIQRASLVFGLSAKPDEEKASTILTDATGLASGTSGSLG